MSSEKQFAQHEEKCERCGRCCRLKFDYDGKVFAGGHCPMFDKEKGCLVYETRFQRVPQCRNIAQAVMSRLLPEDCPYVRDFPGYKSVVDDWGESE